MSHFVIIQVSSSAIVRRSPAPPSGWVSVGCYTWVFHQTGGLARSLICSTVTDPRPEPFLPSHIQIVMLTQKHALHSALRTHMLEWNMAMNAVGRSPFTNCIPLH